jgi:hypothetical protein
MFSIIPMPHVRALRNKMSEYRFAGGVPSIARAVIGSAMFSRFSHVPVQYCSRQYPGSAAAWAER